MNTGNRDVLIYAAVTLTLNIALFTLLTLIFSSWHKTSDVTLPDGRHVYCVKTVSGGITCDWNNTR